MISYLTTLCSQTIRTTNLPLNRPTIKRARKQIHLRVLSTIHQNSDFSLSLFAKHSYVMLTAQHTFVLLSHRLIEFKSWKGP